MKNGEIVWHVFKLNPLAKLPTKEYDSAGWDLYCVGQYILSPGDTLKIHTGLGGAFPPGHVAIIYDRSSMGAGGIPHFAGVIDHDYRGEIMVVLHNTTKQMRQFNHGDKICQIIIHKLPHVEMVEVDGVGDLPEELIHTKRGAAGFGSTGGNQVSTEQKGLHAGNVNTKDRFPSVAEPSLADFERDVRGVYNVTGPGQIDHNLSVIAPKYMKPGETMEQFKERVSKLHNEQLYAETQDELESVPPTGPEREAFEKQVTAANEFKMNQAASAQVVKKDDEGTWKKK